MKIIYVSVLLALACVGCAAEQDGVIVDEKSSSFRLPDDLDATYRCRFGKHLPNHRYGEFDVNITSSESLRIVGQTGDVIGLLGSVSMPVDYEHKIVLSQGGNLSYRCIDRQQIQLYSDSYWLIENKQDGQEGVIELEVDYVHFSHSMMRITAKKRSQSEEPFSVSLSCDGIPDTLLNVCSKSRL